MNNSEASSPKKMFKGNMIIVVGPTASGKTKLAIDLAKQLNTVVISADSRQFYREIQIGTAAPDKAEQDGITHYFIGNLSIEDYYNVSMYEQDVIKLLDNELFHHKNVIIAGGSGLYIDAICNGIDELPNIDPGIRIEVKDLYNEKGLEGLIDILIKDDPEYMKVVDAKNPMRLMRAIEVCWQTGLKYSDLRQNKNVQREFNIIKIGSQIDRPLLIERINNRTDQMLESGWVEEAKKVIKYRDHNALNTVGYKELFDYFDNKISFEEARDKIKTSTRRYAKRQMTWFRKDKDINWFKTDETDLIFDFLISCIS